MDIQTAINEAYRAYRGKIASKTPAWGSDKANVALSIANSKVREWATSRVWASNFNSGNLVNQPGTVATTGTTTLTGTSTYFTDFEVGDTILVSGETVRTIVTITSDTVLTVTVAFTNTASSLTFTRKPIISTSKEYTLHRNILTPSDKVTVSTTQKFTYNLTSPQARLNGDVYISGRYPKKLSFYNDIDTATIGGELKVPGYYQPSDMVNSTDLVSVDDPNWLVLVVAAELCRNDPAKDNQFANLLGMANELYKAMVENDLLLSFPQGMSIPNEMPQVNPDLDEGWGA